MSWVIERIEHIEISPYPDRMAATSWTGGAESAYDFATRLDLHRVELLRQRVQVTWRHLSRYPAYMGWVEGVVIVIQALIWPIVVIIAFFLFKKPLSELWAV